MAGARAPYVPGLGLPWPADRAGHGEDARPQGGRVQDRVPQALPRICREVTSRSNGRSSGASAFLATGTTPTSRWTPPTRPRSASSASSSNRRSIYRGRKPVLWCPSCETALAEAEVEYENHVVPFDLRRLRPVRRSRAAGSVAERKPRDRDLDDHALDAAGEPRCRGSSRVSTTSSLDADGSVLMVVAEGLLKQFCEGDRRRLIRILAEFQGSALERPADPPSLDRSRFACDPRRPRHPRGRDGRRAYGARATARRTTRSGCATGSTSTRRLTTGPVHDGGGRARRPAGLRRRYRHHRAAKRDGRVLAAEKIVPLLSALLAVQEPRDLPGHGPVVRLDGDERSPQPCSRDRSGQLGACVGQGPDPRHDGEPAGLVHFAPASLGCADRCLHLRGLRETFFSTRQIADHVAAIFEKEGADAWFERSAKELLPPGHALQEMRRRGISQGERTSSTSGSTPGVSHAAVLKPRKDLSWPADMYLEGSDQHRGWFQSSLLDLGRDHGEGALRDRADARLHGGRRGKEDDQVGGQRGCAAGHHRQARRRDPAALGRRRDYRDDVRISQEIVGRLIESFRRVRNTARFLIANLYDFEPDAHAVLGPRAPRARSLDPRAHALLVERCRKAYFDYEFHVVYHALNNFCSVDLSALYLDIVKDRLYCSSAAGRRAVRRKPRCGTFSTCWRV